jgi:hypothetical protein
MRRVGPNTRVRLQQQQKTKEILGKEVEMGKSILPQIIPLLQGTGLSVRDTGTEHFLACVGLPAGLTDGRGMCVQASRTPKAIREPNTSSVSTWRVHPR